MNIHEYQAKGLLKEFGVPVPQGGLAVTRRKHAPWPKAFRAP